VLATVASRLVAMAGIHPHAALNFLRFGGPGNFVRALRRYRGLDAPIRSRGDTVVEPKISR
jgi:hypothetical protein